ncbi:MAG: peptidylprolyl isomerase [Clostridia bacterium]|nr:peptidylprolyl isomerase [Clostridia bacterium]
MKKIISSLLAGAMLFSAMPVVAADINITINGTEFIPKNALGEVVTPFIENGSTFLPVRAMGTAVGKEVSFDAENYSVYIGAEPTDAAKKDEPILLIGDKVFFKSDLQYYVDIENIIDEAKIITLAKEKYSDAEIEEYYNEICERNGRVETEEDKRYLYYAACSSLLNYAFPDGCAPRESYVTAQHILVKDEEDALKVIDALNDGVDFNLLIEEYNTDPGQMKGTSYTFTYGEMVEEFETAAFSLEVEAYTLEPVKSTYGYHVIKRLPLNEEFADAHYYQKNILPIEIENADIGKVVEVEKSGVYGKIEGVEITVDAMDKIFPEGKTEEKFEALGALAIVLKIMNENNLFVDEREVYEAEIRQEIVFDESTDEKTAEYMLDIFAAAFVYMDEFSYGSVVEADMAELFLVEENFPEIEKEIYKDIKVFVDGKLIIPCDVNNNYVAPKNIDGTVYVPVRAIVEALSMKAEWDNDTRTVVITGNR